VFIRVTSCVTLASAHRQSKYYCSVDDDVLVCVGGVAGVVLFCLFFLPLRFQGSRGCATGGEVLWAPAGGREVGVGVGGGGLFFVGLSKSEQLYRENAWGFCLVWFVVCSGGGWGERNWLFFYVRVRWDGRGRWLRDRVFLFLLFVGGDNGQSDLCGVGENASRAPVTEGLKERGPTKVERTRGSVGDTGLFWRELLGKILFHLVVISRFIGVE